MDKIEDYVVSCYRKFLGREPDTSGLDYYTTSIRNGLIKMKDLPSIFEKSEEHMKRKEYANWWKAETFEDAKKLILSPDGSVPSTELFSQAGQNNAKTILSFINKDSVILDYGCGVGRVAKFLSPHVKQIRAIDISREMIKLGKEFCKECNNIEFILTDGVKMPLDDSSIDFAYSILTLQHVEREDAYLILRDINRVLKEGGKFYVTFPDITSEAYWNGFESYAFNLPLRISGRARMYTVPEVEIMMKKAGFKIISIPSHSNEIKESNIVVIAEKLRNKK